MSANFIHYLAHSVRLSGGMEMKHINYLTLSQRKKNPFSVVVLVSDVNPLENVFKNQIKYKTL